jgi:glycosyltransferase involved in cell wall biosynthesis
MSRAQQPPLRGHVHFPGYVSDDARRALYQGAAVFVLPSLHEGFGMTVLEAMTLAVPVIAANRGSLPEVMGDAGVLIDPTNSSALAAAMAHVLDDPAFADQCRARGLARAATFSWRTAAEALLRAYELALAHRRRRA